MKAMALSHFPYPVLSTIGMLLFLAVFIGAFLWTYRRAGKRSYAEIGALPLECEEPHQKENAS